MNGNKSYISLSIFLCLMMVVGCAKNTSVIRLNEKEIAEQERIAEQARQHFYCAHYDQIPQILNPLCLDRTTSQPLYLCELGTGYLAYNDKPRAKENLLEAYKSIEGFFDPTSEKKAVSLWGAESDKVYKGEPYEQATLSLLTGLLLLEEGDVDNALACFKNGQIADSDVEQDRYRSDYGSLQLLEAKCYQLRGDTVEYTRLLQQAKHSFAKTHPFVIFKRNTFFQEIQKQQLEEDEISLRLNSRTREFEEKIIQEYQAYYHPLTQQYNTLLLIWTGQAPRFQRTGQYGEQRVLVKNPSKETHFEVYVSNVGWFDVIRGFGNVTFQATTRGGREMDNVLANQAAFKQTTHEIGNTFIDAADDVSDPYAALVLLGIGLVSHGVGAATNVEADIRCWKTLPDQFSVVPLQLTPGTYRVRVDCYDNSFLKQRSLAYDIAVQNKPFQFFNIIVPTGTYPDIKEEAKSVQEINSVAGS
jgi:hypothetical protein